MFIEFIGLPGSGKTYFCGQIDNELSKKSIKSCNLIELSRSRFFYKLFFKSLRAYAKINGRTRRLSRRLEELLAPYRGIRAKYNECFIDSYISDICTLVILKNLLGKSKRVFLLDEGLFQRAVTMAVNYNLCKSDIIKLLSVLKRYTDSTVYIKISCEDSLRSVRQRNRHVCAMDNLNDEELKSFLKKYYASCEYISERFHLTVLHRGNPENLKIFNQKFRFGGN